MAAFEDRYRIKLPSDYRAFVTCVANGGAGPAYGMFTLEETVTQWRFAEVPEDFVGTPFPHTQAYNPYRDPQVEPYREAAKRGDSSAAEAKRRLLYQAAGTLVLCHEGCGYLHLLVVAGPAFGQMWLDGRCSDQGFVPLRVGFFDWYERWLDNTLAGGRGTWWSDPSWWK